jgi:hypothetical protein
MRRICNKSKIKFLLLAGLSTYVGLIASPEAEAAYSGTVVRSVCMAGAMVPRNPDRNFWDNSANTTCSAKVIDGSSSTNFHWARVSIPVERQISTTSIFASTRVNAGASGNGQVSIQLWLSDAAGNLSTGAHVDSRNPFGFETLTTSALTLPINGAALVDIAAQNTGEAHVVSLNWIANGT